MLSFKDQKQWNSISLFWIGGLAILLSSCGKETLSDSLNRDLDRSRANANVLKKTYGQIVGTYVTDDSKDLSLYQVKLKISMTAVNQPGYLTAQPSLIGDILIKEKADIKEALLNGKTDAEVTATKFNVSNGVYDDGTSVFAANVAGLNTPGINVNCTYDQVSAFECNWNPLGGKADSFKFSLKKTTDSSP